MISSNVKENQGEPRHSPVLRLKSRKVKIYLIFPNFSLKIGENPDSHLVSSTFRGKSWRFCPPKVKKSQGKSQYPPIVSLDCQGQILFSPGPWKIPTLDLFLSCPVLIFVGIVSPSRYLTHGYPTDNANVSKQEVMQTRHAYVIHEVALSVHNCRNLESMWDDAAVIQLYANMLKQEVLQIWWTFVIHFVASRVHYCRDLYSIWD